MPVIRGTFVNERGNVVVFDDYPLTVTADQARLHLNVATCGKGTVRMRNKAGTGTFTTFDGQSFQLTVLRTGSDPTLRYWIRQQRNATPVANGEFRELGDTLPPPRPRRR